MWSQDEEQQIIRLFQYYGKAYTNISHQLADTFREYDKYNSNRISSRIGSLMREGVLIIKAAVPNHKPLVLATANVSTSVIVRKIMTLPNDEFFIAKGKLVALKNLKDKHLPILENDLKQIVSLLLYALGSQIPIPSISQNQEKKAFKSYFELESNTFNFKPTRFQAPIEIQVPCLNWPNQQYAYGFDKSKQKEQDKKNIQCKLIQRFKQISKKQQFIEPQ